MSIGTGTNTCTASNADWIGTYPGSLLGGMCVRFAEIKTERSGRMTPEEQRQKKNQDSLASYYLYKGHHICVRCNRAPAVDGLVTCQACREVVNASNRFRYAALTPEQKKKGQAKTKAIRSKWREQGRCTRCGREREDPNLLTCEHCRRGDRERKCKR